MKNIKYIPRLLLTFFSQYDILKYVLKYIILFLRCQDEFCISFPGCARNTVP